MSKVQRTIELNQSEGSNDNIRSGEETGDKDIEVTIVDKDGNELSEALVVIDGPIKTEANTDSDGVVTFRNIPKGSYTVLAKKEDYSTEAVGIHTSQFD